VPNWRIRSKPNLKETHECSERAAAAADLNRAYPVLDNSGRAALLRRLIFGPRSSAALPEKNQAVWPFAASFVSCSFARREEK
jgi:hypothetical protein